MQLKMIVRYKQSTEFFWSIEDEKQVINVIGDAPDKHARPFITETVASNICEQIALILWKAHQESKFKLTVLYRNN